jgi:hypothetical protein
MVTYVEDDGTWRRRYGVNSDRTATVVVDPAGKVVWRSETPSGTHELPAVLRKVLGTVASSKATMLTANVRIAQPPPNFLFEHSPGQQLTLRKTIGRPVVIVFFRESSSASIEAVKDAAASVEPRTILLAVTPDGGGRDDISPAILVHDAAGRIATAYGVSMWPTTVRIDQSGIVRGVEYGRLTKGEKTRA